MNIQIALSPDLEITPSEFAAAWNQTPDALAVAQARVESAQGGTFLDPVTIAFLTVSGNVLVGLATNALYDLIKKELSKKGVKKRAIFIDHIAPDGSRTIVVEAEESE